MDIEISDDQLIDLAGGPTAVALLCGEEVNTVSNWKLRKRIPRGWKRFLAEKLPDIQWFPPEGSEGQPIPPTGQGAETSVQAVV